MTKISGVAVIELAPFRDHRGSFERMFDVSHFAALGIDFGIVQVNLSRTGRAGTVRGIHYQRPPAEEAKLVRCVRGRSWHALVDARPEAATRLQTETIELREGDARVLYVAEGIGHGFQALEDHTTVLYLASKPHAPTLEAGFRPDDPALAIPWPLPPSNLSEKDRSWPLLDPTSTSHGPR